MTNVSRVIIAAVSLLLPAVAGAQDWQSGSTMYMLKGTLVADQANAEKIGYDAFQITFVGQPTAKNRWIGIVSANTWEGDSFTAKEVLDNIIPPVLVVDGKAPLLKQLSDAPVGSRVALEGMLVPSSGNYVLASVRILSKP